MTVPVTELLVAIYIGGVLSGAIESLRFYLTERDVRGARLMVFVYGVAWPVRPLLLVALSKRGRFDV